MADDQSWSQNLKGFTQETSNQDSSISSDVEGDVPATAQHQSLARKCEATPTQRTPAFK